MGNLIKNSLSYYYSTARIPQPTKMCLFNVYVTENNTISSCYGVCLTVEMRKMFMCFFMRNTSLHSIP